MDKIKPLKLKIENGKSYWLNEQTNNWEYLNPLDSKDEKFIKEYKKSKQIRCNN